jgi:hypothetical protein
MKLGKKQELFQRKIVRLKIWLWDHGYEFRGGDAFRDPRLHGRIGIKKGYGHKNSCHKYKLAEDLYIRKRDESDLLETFEEHLPIGEYWESIGGSWGGRFSSIDCVHFSLEYQGMK